MLPYFEILLRRFEQGDANAKTAFGENVHWGYWDEPPLRPVTSEDFREAGIRMTRETLAGAKVSGGYSVLDVGCGFGGTLRLLNDAYHDCELAGVNIDERQIAIARANVRPANDNKVAFACADAGKLPYADGSFDRVVCVESILHFPSKRQFFGEASRVLRPGGVLVVSDFVPRRPSRFLMQAFERTFGLVGRAYGPIHLDTSLSGYARMAHLSGLRLDTARDITKNTMPTYAALNEHFAAADEFRALYIATSLIEWVSRMHLLRYLILAFRKES